MSVQLLDAVRAAIDELREDFPDATIVTEPDGAGGARVQLEGITLGTPYKQDLVWVGAHLPAQLPYADIYPIFVDGGLQRVDGKAHGPGLSMNHRFMSRNAIQVSRRSNRANLGSQTAAMKILKVLHWLKTL